MRNSISVIFVMSMVLSLVSCGIPTALVRTYKNSLDEVTEISNGTSTAYKDVN